MDKVHLCTVSEMAFEEEIVIEQFVAESFEAICEYAWGDADDGSIVPNRGMNTVSYEKGQRQMRITWVSLPFLVVS